MIRFAAALFALSLLAGCASGAGRYPSLAPRAAEKQGFAEPIVKAAVAAPDPAIDQRIADQASDLDHLAAGFATAADAARRLAEQAAHQSVGSDAWLNTQAGLAKVDDWRTRMTALSAAIEAAGSARAAALQPAYPPLDALAARAAAETDREAAVVERLQAMLPAA